MKMVHFRKLNIKLGTLFMVLCLLALNVGSVSAQDTWRGAWPTMYASISSTMPMLSPTDVLFNGGFENGDAFPLGWQAVAWDMTGSSFSWDTNQKHSGNRSIKISNNTANDSRWNQDVYVQPNSDYRLSGWIKTDNIDQSQGGTGANLSYGAFLNTLPLLGTNNWTYVSVDFNTGSETQITISARIGMFGGVITGTAWFDDLKLELLSASKCYALTKDAIPTGGGMVIAYPLPNCANGTQYTDGTVVKLTITPKTNYNFVSWGGACSGTGDCIVSMTSTKSVTANFSQSSTKNPQWKILVLIYSSTDFTYSDGQGQHHVVASMSQNEIDRAVFASNKFIGVDIPALTSGNMFPLLTIRYPNHSLSSLDSFCGYWPSRANTYTDLDPLFDSVIVIWDDSGIDQVTGKLADLNGCGGLTASNGIGQTYATFVIDMVASNQRNVFKHEWGHSILFYFDAAGESPKPTVDNHIDPITNPYVHCPSGIPYISGDETDDNPIPNSGYNDYSGFTHDYYSGTTAKPENPIQCLGINSTTWSYGGPVTKTSTTFSDVPFNYWALNFVERLYGAGITGGCGTNPVIYCPEATVTRAQMAIFLLRGMHGSSYAPPAVADNTNFGDVSTTYWAAAWIKQLAAEGITGGCGTGIYCPEGAVTRAQMAVFLLRSKHGASYSPPAAGGSTGFTDVAPAYWAGAWIKQLVAEGITAGCGSGTYCPESPVTRAQMAVFLVRTFNLP